MGFYRDHVLPRFTDVALGTSMEATRARVCRGLSGEVLELGFGSGRNLNHLPPGVTRVLAVEPAPGGRRLAARRIAAARVPVEFVGDDGQKLPLPDGSVDHVLVTWTLCTIPHVERALEEVRRVLRPGGALHFVEHGLSPNVRMARWQDRLTPAWGKLVGGCHLNRRIDALVEESGLVINAIDRYNGRVGNAGQDSSGDGGPLARALTGATEFAGFMYEGVAAKPG